MMLQLLRFSIHTIQPFLVPICFVSAWGFVIAIAWSLWSAVRDGVSTTKRLHQIPCSDCQYFTGDYRLKCTIRPSVANTEAAIDCLDYQPKTNPFLY